MILDDDDGDGDYINASYVTVRLQFNSLFFESCNVRHLSHISCHNAANLLRNLLDRIELSVCQHDKFELLQ